MAAVTLEIVIPDNPALQQKILDTVAWLHRGDDGTIPNYTPAQVKAWLEKEAGDRLRATLRREYKSMINAQSVDLNFG